MRRSRLANWGFWRVVLDEAQQLAERNDCSIEPVLQLWRQNAWVVSGTPFNKYFEELKARPAPAVHACMHVVGECKSMEAYHAVIFT